MPSACTIPTRIDLLFTMSDNTQPQVLVRTMRCELVSRGRCRTCALSSCRPAIKPSGGARRDRTDDLMLAKHALSQLSYGPVTRRRMPCCARKVVGLGRLELPTSRLSSARSNQLSYKPLTLNEACGAAIHDAVAPDRCAQPLARVRPRRKRNEDGEIPPMELIGIWRS